MAASAPPPKKLGDCEVCIPWDVARENNLINKAGRVPDRCTVQLIMRLAPRLPLPDGNSAPEGGTPDERLSVSFARREPVKGSDYVANCRALEREHGNGLSFTLRSALRTATRAKQEFVVGSKPKGPRDLHLTITGTVDGLAPCAVAEEEEAQKKEADQGQQGDGAAGTPAGPPMPETPDLIDPQEGATITITPQQLRKNGMLKVAANYHAPAEIKHVPLIEWPNATEPERVALLKWVVQDLRWNKASGTFWVKLVPPSPEEEEANQTKGNKAEENQAEGSKAEAHQTEGGKAEANKTGESKAGAEQAEGTKSEAAPATQRESKGEAAPQAEPAKSSAAQASEGTQPAAGAPAAALEQVPSAPPAPAPAQEGAQPAGAPGHDTRNAAAPAAEQAAAPPTAADQGAGPAAAPARTAAEGEAAPPAAADQGGASAAEPAPAKTTGEAEAKPEGAGGATGQKRAAEEEHPETREGKQSRNE
ncbi:hypothetical protein DUNSADRAFT_3071 [Dunaliella salina]|uniref:Encoded protein n=1 Tax=Dunaliella salina TaxID=3046 RepID=A0ABZ3KB92_DUNSA|nr:hypothetical protein DUNSADRAFT_3071 [Dunaliella salina]|eukprot:KAF5826440.1 hypothetical protein DUNSADRAFT_3071 [Dunaliella salina]